MIAIRKLQYDPARYFYPMPDIEHLYTVLTMTTTNALMLMNPSLAAVASAPGMQSTAASMGSHCSFLKQHLNLLAAPKSKKAAAESEDAAQARMRALRKKLDAEAAERRKREEVSKNREPPIDSLDPALDGYPFPLFEEEPFKIPEIFPTGICNG